MENKRINVTKSYLPPMNEYIEKISCIWDNHHLTNFGPLHNELEEKLAQFLKVEQIHYVNNGTIAIQLAIDALDIMDGEIITTPFTFVATSSAIVWQRCRPIFVDINEDNYNINADKIEEAITDKTKAILAVHCFGIPCDVQKIEKISKKHNLPVIYDAAHSFGTKINDRSILSYGDIVTCSLHATKIFHSVEGGLCIVNNEKYNDKLNSIKNFGIMNGNYEYVGINAKCSEFHAAMGLCVLEHYDEIIAKRKEIYELYEKYLENTVELLKFPANFTYNYIYFPVLFNDEKTLLEVFESLNSNNIFPRRYFYPALNNTKIYSDNKEYPNATSVSNKIACLPLDTYLEPQDISLICGVIKEKVIKYKKI